MIIAWPERFWRNVERPPGEAGCWRWVGNKNSNGYGTTSNGGIKAQAHRVAYELVVGPIPAGLELDHLCRNRDCVNPAHMEPVTHRENVRRGTSPPAKAAVATHCKRGHPFSGDNLIIGAQRMCRACRAINSRAAAARQSPERRAAHLKQSREYAARRRAMFKGLAKGSPLSFDACTAQRVRDTPTLRTILSTGKASTTDPQTPHTETA